MAAPDSAIAKYKVVILGDESVGKSSIMTRFVHNAFDRTYLATTGFDFLTKKMSLGDETVRLRLWDVGGHERYRRHVPSYIKDSPVAVIVYDVTSRQTFLNTSYWIEMVRRERGSDVIIVLMGNKTDLVYKRQVSTEEGEAKARELNAMFFETSPKTDFNKSIKADFRKIVDALLAKKTPDSVVFLGDQSVGKTSILIRFLYDQFNPIHQATIGVDFLLKTVDFEDRTVRFQWCDTGGRESDRCHIPICVKDSSVVVIAYDVTSRQTFLNTSYWIDMVRRESSSDVIIVLAGNKTDLVDKRQVSTGEGEAKACELNAIFIEASAKAGFNSIKALFKKIVDVSLDKKTRRSG